MLMMVKLFMMTISITSHDQHIVSNKYDSDCNDEHDDDDVDHAVDDDIVNCKEWLISMTTFIIT